MRNRVLAIKSTKYELKLDNFEGPLDLLLYLIDKNEMDIYKVNISEITEQYIDYLNEQKKLNMDITSEFLVMASTLLLIKSRGLIPKGDEEEVELTEEELLRRIIEYKKYKEISNIFRERIIVFSKRFYKKPDEVELPKLEIDKEFTANDIIDSYKKLVERNENKKNENAKNIERIALRDNFSVSDKVREIVRELISRPKFIFNKLFSLSEKPKEEVVTAFSGALELSRRNKVTLNQEELFGDIEVSRAKGNKYDEEINIEEDLF